MNIYDIAIIGGGPAGLSAALTASVRGWSVIIFEANGFGPQVRKASAVTDYLGFENCSGQELMDTFLGQMKAYEPTIVEERVLNIGGAYNGYAIATEQGMYRSKSVVLASGVATSMYVQGEKAFKGRGVNYTIYEDLENWRDKDIAVIYGIDTAKEQVEKLAAYCKHIYLFIRHGVGADIDLPNVEIIEDDPIEIYGTDSVTGITTGDKYYGVLGVVIFREVTPIDYLLKELEMQGKYVDVDSSMETSLEGVFAAGNCVGKPFKIAKSVGQGQVAAMSAEAYLNRLKKINK